MARAKPGNILLVGGGGHSRVVLSTLRALGNFQIVGLVDKNLKPEVLVNGVKVLGSDEVLQEVYRQGCDLAFISVGSVGNSGVRRKLFEKLTTIGFSLPSLVDPKAVVDDSVQLGAGTYVAAGAVVQSGAVIGKNVIINTGAVVDHDCSLGDFVHLAPGATLSGGVHVGEGSHIGTGSSVIEGISVGNQTMIGAGSVVIRDIPDDCKAFGNPCRIQEKTK
ncbi:MAG: acetyltransferase [Deltaproteobacteria bacterium]|nr:acetyltransferase [Deltaproteobacteria bacterium]MBI4196335.1 acetyltransferase [Deltaproteobacteria bacterium]